MNDNPSDWDELADTNAAAATEWDDTADTNAAVLNDWDDTADTNPGSPVPTPASPSIPAAFVAGADEAFGAAAVLNGPGTIVLDGSGCVYAPSTTLRLVPLEDGVEVWTTSYPASAELRLTLKLSDWEDWLRRIVETLAHDVEPYSPSRRQELIGTSGSRGSVGVDLPCVGGDISYTENGALNDRPAQLAQLVLDLLAEHEIVLDPNHVPD